MLTQDDKDNNILMTLDQIAFRSTVEIEIKEIMARLKTKGLRGEATEAVKYELGLLLCSIYGMKESKKESKQK